MSGNDLESGQCDVCGSPLGIHLKGLCKIIRCGGCGREFAVSSHIPAICLDPTVYRLSLKNGDSNNIEHIKIIAETTKLNFVETKKLMQSTSPEIFAGRAVDALKVKTKLKHAGLITEVSPPFQYMQYRMPF